MAHPVSPLAPTEYPELPEIAGVRFATAEAGIKYTLVDDTHFKATGLRGDQLFGYYQTEEQGESLSLFPICGELRALIPFQPPEKVIEHLRAHATPDGARLLLAFDDGAKFGGWPNTYHAVYIDGWLERFFTLLEANQDWVSTVTVGGYRERYRPWGRIYLPAASFREMQGWALPPGPAAVYNEARNTIDPRFQDFLHGGYWRHFLVRYPEANNLHKKMLRVAAQVKGLKACAGGRGVPVGAGGGAVAEDDPAAAIYAEALDALWRGQSNDPYWHGVFGGIYLNHLRGANYAALIQAEVACDRLRHGEAEFCELEIADFDRDGVEEIVAGWRGAGGGLSMYTATGVPVRVALWMIMPTSPTTAGCRGS